MKVGERTLVLPDKSLDLIPAKLMFTSDMIHQVIVRVLPPEEPQHQLLAWVDAGQELYITITCKRHREVATGGTLHVIMPGHLFQDVKLTRMLSIEVGYLGTLGDMYNEYIAGDMKDEYWLYDPMSLSDI